MANREPKRYCKLRVKVRGWNCCNQLSVFHGFCHAGYPPFVRLEVLYLSKFEAGRGVLRRVLMKWKYSVEFPLSVVARSERGSWEYRLVYRLPGIERNVAGNEDARPAWLGHEGKSATISAVSSELAPAWIGHCVNDVNKC